MNKYNAYKGHPVHKGKHWDNENHLIGKSFKRVNENQWFETQQPLLLWMANQKYGRELLGIDRNFPKIIEISKKHITGHLGYEKLGKDTYLHRKISDFRVGAKYANIIRYRWKEFQEYAQAYYRIHDKVLGNTPVMFPVVPQWGFAYVTSTFYPDADPETTSSDTNLARAGVSEIYATIRGGAGTGFEESAATSITPRLDATITTDQYSQMNRANFLFDTSSIPDGDTVDSTTFSLVFAAKTDQLSQSYNLTSTSPASNTAGAAADYNLANFGTTKFSTDKTLTDITADDATYNDWALNASGLSNISKTGVSKFGLRFAGDIDNTTPTWVSGHTARTTTNFADQTGTTKDPKLVVVHGGAAANHWLLMGV